MSGDGKPKNIVELIRDFLTRKFGLVNGLMLLALLSAIAYGYTNWDKVMTWPGVNYLLQRSIPKADPNRFSIVIVHIENDTNYEQERLIVESLKEFEGVQVLSLDRTISLKGSIPEEQEKRGYDIARDYLKKSGASVLIWGTVLRQGDKVVPKLYWTLSSSKGIKPSRYSAPLTETQLQLPAVFWSDLAEILQLLVITGSAEFDAEEGHYIVDQLKPFIGKVRTLLKSSLGRPGWDTNARGATYVILANSLSILGEQNGQVEPLEEAVAAFREALKEYTRDRVPLDWAMTQGNLGGALGKLGEREFGTKRLEEAADACREALKEYTRDCAPLDWAGTQNNLGNILASIGERETGTKRLEEAVAAYREALKEYTRDRVPLKWALTQNNLGNALTIIGDRETGTKRLEEAADACREALKEYTRDRVPLSWALTQRNLGNALTSLGERETGTKRLEEAVATYREALKEYTRDRMPFAWAETQNNLGSALKSLGKREAGTKRLEEAVATYREALKEYTRDRVPFEFVVAQNGLGNTLTSLGERETGTKRLEEAVAAYREAFIICNNRRCITSTVRANLQRAEALLRTRMK